MTGRSDDGAGWDRKTIFCDVRGAELNNSVAPLGKRLRTLKNRKALVIANDVTSHTSNSQSARIWSRQLCPRYFATSNDRLPQGELEQVRVIFFSSSHLRPTSSSTVQHFLSKLISISTILTHSTDAASSAPTHLLWPTIRYSDDASHSLLHHRFPHWYPFCRRPGPRLLVLLRRSWSPLQIRPLSTDLKLLTACGDRLTRQVDRSGGLAEAGRLFSGVDHD